MLLPPSLWRYKDGDLLVAHSLKDPVVYHDALIQMSR